MRPAASLLVRAYPARWRARYGDEFLSVLEERPLGPFDVADVLLGALDAHLHLRGLGAASAHSKGFAMTLRLGGYAAILGGLLFFIGLAAASALGDAGGVFILAFAAGAAALLVALAGLSAFQARRYPKLVWAAFILPAIGAVVTIIGVLGMVFVGDGLFIGQWSAWAVWFLGLAALIIGSGLFAVATYLSHTLSRTAAIMLVVASVGLVPLAHRDERPAVHPGGVRADRNGRMGPPVQPRLGGARRERRAARQPRPHRAARSVVMTRLSLGLATGVVLAAVVAAPVAANHGHVMALGNGECVLLAANGGEDEVELPPVVFDANPNVDIAPGADRLHPLHVLVHQGVPGEHNAIAVAGTPAAAALCPDGIVND